MGVRRIFSSENPSSICRETDDEIGGGAEEREVGFCKCRERQHARTFLGFLEFGSSQTRIHIFKDRWPRHPPGEFMDRVELGHI